MNKDIQDNIAKTLDIPADIPLSPLPAVIPKKEIEIIDKNTGEVLSPNENAVFNKEIINSDLVEVRNNLRSLSVTTQEAIDELMKLAVISQESKAFEVLGKLIETASSLSRDVIHAHERISKIHNHPESSSNSSNGMPQNQQQNAGTINNIVLTGTTKDILSIMEGEFHRSKSVNRLNKKASDNNVQRQMEEEKEEIN